MHDGNNRQIEESIRDEDEREKACRGCDRVLQLRSFAKDKTHSDGHSSRCKECRNAYVKKWRENDPVRAREITHRSYQKHKEKYRIKSKERYDKCGAESKRKWNSKNRDKSRASCRKWSSKNPEKTKALSKKNYENNKERHKAQAYQWIKDNPQKRSLIMAQQNAKRKARIHENGYEKISVKQWLNILERAEQKCLYCGATQNLSIDHFVPISKGGGHLIKNILPACKPCNTSKWNNLPEKWVLEKYGKEKYEQILEFISNNE